MTKPLQSVRAGTAWFVVSLFIVVLLAALPSGQAQAIENLPTDTGNLNGTNWMSGISGENYLHQITIPGTHDSGMANVWAREGGGKDIMDLAKKSAITQDLYIDEQLNAGVRLFDLRLTELNPVVKGTDDMAEGGLWVCHGPNVLARVWSATYYSLVPDGKV